VTSGGRHTAIPDHTHAKGAERYQGWARCDTWVKVARLTIMGDDGFMAIDLPFEATDPNAVLLCVFSIGLANIAPLPLDDIDRPFDEVAGEWGSQGLFKGSEEAIAEFVRANLCRISRQTGFAYFRVHRRDDAVIQVTSFFPNASVPLQIWKSGDQLLTNGNPDYDVVDVDSDGEPVQAPWTLWGQGTTCLVCHEGKLDTTIWEGTSRALLRSLPQLVSPTSIVTNFLRFALDPDDNLPPSAQLKCSHCATYSMRCPRCYHMISLEQRLPAFHVLHCKLCGGRFRNYRDG
jgi:hypothetical protein